MLSFHQEFFLSIFFKKKKEQQSEHLSLRVTVVAAQLGGRTNRMAHSAQHHLFRSGSSAGSVHTPNTVVLVQAQTFLGDQEWFPVMPGIWVAGVATASAR